jgi:hypothetical protein
MMRHKPDVLVPTLTCPLTAGCLQPAVAERDDAVAWTRGMDRGA